MDIAEGLGSSEQGALYCVPDDELPTGSTLGGPKVCAVIKATGALEKVYSIDRGEVLFGTLVLHHWDEQTGMNLAPLHPGTFTIHPEHQEREFRLSNDVHVHEDIFVLSGAPQQNSGVDPPAVYYTAALCNESGEEQHISTYAFCELRGNTAPDVVTTYDSSVGALIAWNASNPDHARIVGCSKKPTSYETTLDYAMAASSTRPRELSGQTNAPSSNPLGVLHLSHTLGPGASVQFYYLLSFSGGGHRGAVKTYHGR